MNSRRRQVKRALDRHLHSDPFGFASYLVGVYLPRYYRISEMIARRR